MPAPRTALRLAIIAASALALAGCATLLARGPVGNTAVPQPAKAVDIQRYLGRWYELARFEQSFQRDCDGVTADYALRDDGKISVINRCRKPDGTMDEARGKAKVVEGANGAKLKVSFFGPFYGDYWVLDRGASYEWAIVGEPSGRYLWLLHREAEPGEVVRDAMIARARALGYDTALLRLTQQP